MDSTFHWSFIIYEFYSRGNISKVVSLKSFNEIGEGFFMTENYNLLNGAHTPKQGVGIAYGKPA